MTQHEYFSFINQNFIDYTLDGGKTINRLRFPQIERYFEMYNENTGVYLANDSLYFTQDGWETRDVISDNGEIFFEYFNFHNIFALNNNEIIFPIYTGNIDFKFVKLDLIKKEFSDYGYIDLKGKFAGYPKIGDIDKINDTTYYLNGFYRTGVADYKNTIFFRSYDTGKTWEFINEDTLSEVFNPVEIAFENELHGIRVGYNLWDETFDGGLTWHRRYSQPNFARSIFDDAIYHNGSFIVGSGSIFKYEEVFEDLNAIEIEISKADDYCYYSDWTMLDSLVTIKNQLVGKDSSFSGNGVEYFKSFFDDETGYYFDPEKAGPGNHEITFTYTNHKYYNLDSLTISKKFNIYVENENPDPIIKQNGNELTTQYEMVRWLDWPERRYPVESKSFKPEEEGKYVAIWTSELGCKEESEPFEFTLTSVANSNKNHFRIYPNYIEFNRDKIKEVSIFNLYGQKQELQIRDNLIYTSNLPVGVYLLSYQIGNEQNTIKFIKE